MLYLAKADVGFKRDLYAFAVAHVEAGKMIVDLISSWQGSRKKPLNSEEIAGEVKELLSLYGLDSLFGDPYADVPIVRDYENIGIRFVIEAQTEEQNFDMFRNFKALIRRGQIDLPDDPVMRKDVLALQSKKRGNRFKIEAPDRLGFHDDVSNVLANLSMKLMPMSSAVDIDRLNASAMERRGAAALQDWREPGEEPEFGGGMMAEVF